MAKISRFTKRILKVTLIIIIYTLVFQIILEIGLHFIMVPSMPTYFLPNHYPNSEVRTTAGTVSAHWISNSQGFHDVEHKLGKVDDKIRIVTIGDSFLDGPQKIPLPLILSSTLNLYRKDTEVINLSRPGIDTNLYYVLFKHAISAYQPDIILVFIFEGNDFRAMDHFSPALYDQSDKFFRRFPLSSFYGNIFPRSTIAINDISSGQFIHRWNNLPKQNRWGKTFPVRNLSEISHDIAKYIEVDKTRIYKHLIQNLTDEEKKELTSYGVRVDLLAYMIGIGLNAKFKPKLGIKEHRPEINDASLSNKQVLSVYNFLKEMNKISIRRKIEFYAVLIPTSSSDPNCANLYARLGAAQDPLFTMTRMKQLIKLKEMLDGEGVSVFNLHDVLDGKQGTYLKFDTHWSVNGVEYISNSISNYLFNQSKILTR